MSDEPSRGSGPPRRREQCQACGASARRGQLICLTCGERMALERSTPPSWRPAAVAATAMVLTAGIALGFVISAVSGGGERQSAAAAPGQRDGPTSAAKPTPAARSKPAATPPALVRARAERARRASRERARRTLAEAAGGWPAGRSGYTVLLVSTDQESAERFAAEVKAAGFDAGVLSAAKHPNLGGTLWTVFSGVFETQPEAVAAATRIRQSYPRAYVQFVEAPTASSTAPPAQPLPE